MLDCNCTLCRRYGALWGYFEPGTVSYVSGADHTDTYQWDSRMLAFHRCRDCGCLTHFEVLQDEPFIYGVNMRMVPTLDPSTVEIRQKNNGHTGFFWTRSDGPILDSQHPELAPPGPDDWR